MEVAARLQAVRVVCDRGHLPELITTFLLLADGRWGSTASGHDPSPLVWPRRLYPRCTRCGLAVPVARKASLDRLHTLLTAVTTLDPGPAIRQTGQNEREISLKMLADALGRAVDMSGEPA